MSETVEMKTCELEGAALDWAVAVIEGYDLMKHPFRRAFIPNLGYCDYSPSTNWTFGGPLIQQFGCDLNCLAPANAWEANCWDSAVPQPDLHICEGETPLIATCRAIVRAKLGETINVPAELISMGGTE